MKMDIDSILYIVITLAILVFSGLSGRRKKRAQMMEAEAQAAERDDSFTEEYDEDQEVDTVPSNFYETLKSTGSSIAQSSNPFERLEQLLGAQSPIITSSEGESMEGESMETVVDEEEQILADIRRRQEAEPSRAPEVEPETDIPESTAEESKGFLKLFGNVDEIKKAVIYSEILNRKY